MMNHCKTFGFLLVMAVVVGGCKQPATTQQAGKTTIWVAKATPEVQQFYYNGIIEPKSIINMSSPVDGVVKDKNFAFGGHVEQSQKLLTIESEKLESDYQQALTDFLKAKESYTLNQSKWRGTEELKKMGLISDNQYTDELQSREENTLQYYQAKQKLRQALRKTNRNSDEVMHYLYRLSLNDIKEVTAVLNSDQNLLVLRAPETGEVLYPEKTADSSGNAMAYREILVGSPIKAGEVVFAIGDLTGFSLAFKVNEVNISKIKLGQPVTVTGVAFPNVILHGKIDSISSQAAPGDGGMPVFRVGVKIPAVTADHRQQIRIGMSAKIQVEANGPSKIQVPIGAVFQEATGENYVSIQSSDQGLKKVAVITGNTSMDKVTILKGLQEGDKVVVPE